MRLSVAYAITLALLVTMAMRDDGVRIWVRPRMGLAPLRVQLFISITDPDLTCPKITVAWSEDSKSEHVADCDPENIPEELKVSKWSPPYQSGEYQIEVTVSQWNRRVVRTESIVVN